MSGERTEYVVAMRLEPDGTVTILEEFGGHGSPDAGGGNETELTSDEQYTWSIQGGKVRIKLVRKNEQRYENPPYERAHLNWIQSSTVELPYLDVTEAKKESGQSSGGWFSWGKPQQETKDTIQKQEGEMETLSDVVYKHSRESGYEIHRNGVWKIQVEVTFTEDEDDDEEEDDDQSETEMKNDIATTDEPTVVPQRDAEASERFNEKVAKYIEDFIEDNPDASNFILAAKIDDIRNNARRIYKKEKDPVLVAAQHYFFGRTFSPVAQILPSQVVKTLSPIWEGVQDIFRPIPWFLQPGPRTDGIYDYQPDVIDWGTAGFENRPPRNNK